MTNRCVAAATVIKDGMTSAKRKTLSVLIPTYNHARYLTRAVLSIAEQSRTPDEIIVIDDGSIDNSYDVLQRLAERFSFLKIGRNQKNLGYLKTTQDMTDMAKGDYVCRLAADDYALQGYVKTLLGLAEQYPQAGIVSGALLYTRGSLEFNWCLNRRGVRFPITKYFGMGKLKAGYYPPRRLRAFS
jgi:glycosyltransferase involved in cell wall biosynthesis